MAAKTIKRANRASYTKYFKGRKGRNPTDAEWEAYKKRRRGKSPGTKKSASPGTKKSSTSKPKPSTKAKTVAANVKAIAKAKGLSEKRVREQAKELFGLDLPGTKKASTSKPKTKKVSLGKKKTPKIDWFAPIFTKQPDYNPREPLPMLPPPLPMSRPTLKIGGVVSGARVTPRQVQLLRQAGY